MHALPLILCLLAADLATANRLLQEGRFEQAADEYFQALQQTPTSVDAMLGMGKSLLGLRQYRQAAGYLSKARQADPGNREVRRTLARVLVDGRQFLPAEELLKQLTTEDPKDNESWYNLGSLYYRRGYYGAALPALERVVTAQPENTQAAVDLAVCRAKLGHSEQAEKDFQKLVANPANDRNPDLLLMYAQLLYDTQRYPQALSRVEQALRATPDAPMAHFWKAKILFGTDHVKEAAPEAAEAVRLAPELPFARALLMNIDQAQGKTADAEAQAQWLREHEDRPAQAGPQGPPR